MTSKTDDDIQRDKEAVQRMVGAKSAMEAALRRIEQLETTLKIVHNIHRDVMRCVGDDAMVSSRFNGNNGAWVNGDPKPVKAHTLSEAIAAYIAKHI